MNRQENSQVSRGIYRKKIDSQRIQSVLEVVSDSWPFEVGKTVFWSCFGALDSLGWGWGVGVVCPISW